LTSGTSDHQMRTEVAMPSIEIEIEFEIESHRSHAPGSQPTQPAERAR
jgi:hypothetical protein